MTSTTDKPVLGIIGGIGSGKSAVAAALTRHGGSVVSGDSAGHAALRDPATRQRIAQRWPNSLDKDGNIDRKALGHAVFANPDQLRHLESIVFPWIKNHLRHEIDAAMADPAVRYVVLDAAVMLEAGWSNVCDKLIFVDAPHNLRVVRTAARGWTPEDLDRREQSQISLDEKREQADAVIRNDGSLANLDRRVDELLVQWGMLAKTSLPT
jgi:dephospho-CoA kinase